MVEIKVRGVKVYKSRGKLYAYHRKSGKRIRAPFGTAAFLAEIERLNNRSPIKEYPPGTLGALLAAYRWSPEFLDLAVRTRADYQKVFDYLKPLDGELVKGIDAATILEIRDAAFAAHKRHFANYVLAVLHMLFVWGKQRNLVDANPAAGLRKIRRPRGMPKANRRWTRDEINIVLDAAPFELRVAIALALCTGMREGDVLHFPWSGYIDGRIEGRASKNGAPIWMPAHPLLQELLDKAPRRSPVIVVGAQGKPFTVNGFRTRFFRLIRTLRQQGKIGAGLTFQGLRTTTATMIAEAGCDTQTIMAITGHQTEAMVTHYRRDADQKDRAVAAIERLDFKRRREQNGDKSV